MTAYGDDPKFHAINGGQFVCTAPPEAKCRTSPTCECGLEHLSQQYAELAAERDGWLEAALLRFIESNAVQYALTCAGVGQEGEARARLRDAARQQAAIPLAQCHLNGCVADGGDQCAATPCTAPLNLATPPPAQPQPTEETP